MEAHISDSENSMSELYLLRNIKEHRCKRCTLDLRTCYASQQFKCFVTSMDAVSEIAKDVFELFPYNQIMCNNFFGKKNRNTKITVAPGVYSKLNNTIVGKIIYAYHVNVYITPLTSISEIKMDCHRQLGQISGKHLGDMFDNREQFGDLFKNVLKEDLGKCHLFVKNPNVDWDLEVGVPYIIGKLKDVK